MSEPRVQRVTGFMISTMGLSTGERLEVHYAAIDEILNNAPEARADVEIAGKVACAQCLRPFRGRADKKYCSNACRQDAYRNRQARVTTKLSRYD